MLGIWITTRYLVAVAILASVCILRYTLFRSVRRNGWWQFGWILFAILVIICFLLYRMRAI